ncbi:MAG: redoxin domain-containing protein [bacterium]
MFQSKILSVLAVVFCNTLMAVTASAQNSDLGPDIGEALPHDLAIKGQPGFDQLVAEKGMVLYFIRSVTWCPYCKKQVIETSAHYQDFIQRGYSVVFVSYDDAQDQAKFKTSKGLKVSFVSDPNSVIIDAFGLRNMGYDEASFAYGTPYPVTFIVDSEKRIQAKFYESDFATNAKSYRQRPATEIILEKLDSL